MSGTPQQIPVALPSHHYDDNGSLSFFIDNDGNIAIVCDEGHAWYGKWTSALTFHDSSNAPDRNLIDAQSVTGPPEWLDEVLANQSGS